MSDKKNEPAAMAPEWFTRSVGSVGLSAHIVESLEAAGLATVGAVLAYADEHKGLTDLKGIGDASETQIKEAFQALQAEANPAAPSADIPISDAQRAAAVKDREEADRKASGDKALDLAMRTLAEQQALITRLQAEQAEGQRMMADLQRQIDAAKRQAGQKPEGPPEELHGPVNVERELRSRKQTWPADEIRKQNPLVVRTYRVEPVGAAVEAGLPHAVVDLCYDPADAKAAYFKSRKIDQHGLPLRITEIAADQIADD